MKVTVSNSILREGAPYGHSPGLRMGLWQSPSSLGPPLVNKNNLISQSSRATIFHVFVMMKMSSFCSMTAVRN